MSGLFLELSRKAKKWTRQWTKPDKEFILAKNWENSISQWPWEQIKQLQNPSSYSFLVSPLAKLRPWAGTRNRFSHKQVFSCGVGLSVLLPKRDRNVEESKKIRDQGQVSMLQV